MWYVYILKCKDESLYTGVTNDLTRRIGEHNHSKIGAKSIRGKLPVKLVYNEVYNTRSEALRRESRVKSLSRKEKIELIRSASSTG